MGWLEVGAKGKKKYSYWRVSPKNPRTGHVKYAVGTYGPAIFVETDNVSDVKKVVGLLNKARVRK
jgi:hypothetical protein